MKTRPELKLAQVVALFKILNQHPKIKALLKASAQSKSLVSRAVICRALLAALPSVDDYLVNAAHANPSSTKRLVALGRVMTLRRADLLSVLVPMFQLVQG